MDSGACDDCGHAVPLAWERCPHCGRPGLFPNVKAAQLESERNALELRYQEALTIAKGRGAQEVVQKLRESIEHSKAVITRPLREIGSPIDVGSGADTDVLWIAGRGSPAASRQQMGRIAWRQGTTPEDDRFVEVHIWGPMTIRTVERILLSQPRRRAVRKSLRDRVRELGVELFELEAIG